MKGRLIAILYFLIIPLAVVKAVALVIAPKANDLISASGWESMTLRVLVCLAILLMALGMFFDALGKWRGPKKPVTR